MTSASAKDHREAILAELTELGMSLARDLHARALAASDDKAANDLARAFHTLSRSVRQTLALQARFERDARLDRRQAVQDEARETLKRVQAKRRQVRDAVAPLIWTEYEADEAEALSGELEAYVMGESAEEDAFLAEPLETLVARIAEALGLAANDAESPDEPSDVPRESSG